MAHDVFISYSTKDKVIADAVCAKLEQDRIRAWIAPRDVPAGANFAQSIIRAINSCKVFVLIWSANTNASGHILNEINQAFDQGITIIPFRIQDVQPTDEMRYYFGRTHWLDAITPPLEKHIATLRDAILVNLGRELKPEPVPVAPPPPPTPPEAKVKPARPPEKRREEKAVAPKLPTAGTAGARKYLPIGIGALVVVALAIAGVMFWPKGGAPTPAQGAAPELVAPSPADLNTAAPAAATPDLASAAIATQTATAGQPWIEAGSRIAEGAYLAYGPLSGSILQDGDPSLESHNFFSPTWRLAVQATFRNPVPPTTGSWAYGVHFNDHAVQVDSNSAWRYLARFGHAGRDAQVFQEGVLSNLNTSESGQNTIRVIAAGEIGELFVNDRLIAQLDLVRSGIVLEPYTYPNGIVAANTFGLISGGTPDESAGTEIVYEDFVVWGLPVR